MKDSLRIFLVDDEAPARARLKTLLGDIQPQCPHQVLGEAENGLQALPQILAMQPDLVLLDVQMPGMNGIELAGHLLQQGAQTVIVFVTAFDEYALQAFDVHALDYLVKPVRAARLAQTLTRVAAARSSAVTANQAPAGAGVGTGGVAGAAVAAAANAAAGAAATALENRAQAVADMARSLALPRQHFSVQERGRVLLVAVRDVLYLRAEQKYVTLRTHEREYLIEDSLVSLEEEFAATFVRVHRNALVMRAAIIGVERGEGVPDGWQVILQGLPERLPISRRQWPIIKALVR
jgi:two-component system response regulator AlgR